MKLHTILLAGLLASCTTDDDCGGDAVVSAPMRATAPPPVSAPMRATAPPPVTDNRFGWVGDSGQKKVTSFKSHPRYGAMTLAEKSDLSPKMPPIWDQGQLGSCVGHGVGRAAAYATTKAGGKSFDPSRLFIYYGAREMEGTIYEDAGCQIVDGVRVTQKFGASPEACWPYIIHNYTRKPPAGAYRQAGKRQVLFAYKVDNTDGKSIRLALSNGYPVVFGSLVYSGIDRVTKSKPVLEMPRKGERPSGGHCMTIVGHSDKTRLYLVDNSWGKSWGVNGRFYIPYDYIHNGRLTEDAWVIENIEIP